MNRNLSLGVLSLTLTLAGVSVFACADPVRTPEDARGGDSDGVAAEGDDVVPRSTGTLPMPSCQTEKCCSLSSVVRGTERADTIDGTRLTECIAALGGNDIVDALHGDDEVFGGDGDDQLTGSPGNDLLSGGLGQDTLYGEGGADVLMDGQERDLLYGGGGDDYLLPGMGADEAYGGGGNDTVQIHDLCELEVGEVFDGGAGTDTLILPRPLEVLQGRGYNLSVLNFESIVVDFTQACEAECTLPCSPFDPDYVDDPDPTTWYVDASGIRFRPTTSLERRTNAWGYGTWLVEDAAFVADAKAGTSILTVHVPESTRSTRAVSMSLHEQSSYISKISRIATSSGLQTEVSTPTFSAYYVRGFDAASPGFVDGAWFDLLATDDGALHAQGAFDDHRFELHGENPGWTLDHVAAPSGEPPIDESAVVVMDFKWLGPYGEAHASGCEAFGGDMCDWLCLNTGVPCGQNPHLEPPGTCSDGISNDGDGLVDSADPECNHDNDYSCDQHPGHFHYWESGESLAVFGDGRFCTENKANWIALITRRGWDAELLFNKGEFNPNWPDQALRYLAGGCWVFDSITEAHDCTSNGNCPTWAAEYPYAGAGEQASAYYGSVWADADHGADHGLKHALHQAHVIYHGKPNDDGTSTAVAPLECQAEEGTGCCGASNADASCGWAGAGVVQWNLSGTSCVSDSAFRTLGHEIGHTFGLVHDSSVGPSVKHDDTAESFMQTPAGTSYALCGGNDYQKDDAMDDPTCSRPPGFLYSGPSQGCTQTCGVASCP